MAIVTYVPPKQKIIDYRNENGGYYEALCEICGTPFYPNRSNAKYCNPNCALHAHRKAIAEGKKFTKAKKGGTVAKQTEKKANEPIEIIGATKVYHFLCKHYNTRGEKVAILGYLKNQEMDFEDIYEYGDYKISRISTLKYHIWKD